MILGRKVDPHRQKRIKSFLIALNHVVCFGQALSMWLLMAPSTSQREKRYLSDQGDHHCHGSHVPLVDAVSLGGGGLLVADRSDKRPSPLVTG